MDRKSFCPFCGQPLTRTESDGRLRLYCPPCDRILYENPVPATAVVVVDEAQHLLLVKRSVPPKIGEWCLPGGFMELGESPEECALRELFEETGLAGRIDTFLGLVASHSQDYHTVLLMGHLVRSFSGTPTPGDDAADVAFFAPDRLPEIAFDSHRHFVRIYYAAYQDKVPEVRVALSQNE
jgi:ADP-ribose pyrophosphatase YjhB (NUDIX family)